MGPAAVLQVLVNANTTQATAELSKFDRQLATTDRQTRKAIKAQLGGSFDKSAFEMYDKRVADAARRAKDRAAFKAELGANFNAAGFNAYERQLSRVESSSKSSNSRMSGAFSGLRSTVVATAGAYVGFSTAISSLQASANFQKAMTLIQTQAGYAARDVKRLTQAVMDLAPKVGFGPEDLAKALYHIASAGVPAKDAMDVLTAAAKGARVGAADLVQTANALVGVMRTAPKDVHGASDAMATLVAIVGKGNMRMDDLTAALSTGVLPAAKTFGLGLKDVGAALDVMTARGMPAELSATRLRMTFSMMAAPTAKAADALKSIGMTSDQMANDMRKPGGLVVALTDVKAHLEKSGMSAVQQAQVISHAFGGGRTSAGVMLLLQNIDDLHKRTDALSQQHGTKALDDAFKKTQQDTAANMERLKATGQTLGISLGNAIAPALPAIVRAGQGIATFVSQMRTGSGAGGQFANAMRSAFGTVKSVVTTVVGAVGGLGNAIKIALALFVVSKLIAFAEGIKTLITTMKLLSAAFTTSFGPIGIFLTVIGIAAGALLRLTGSQRGATTSARELRDAWRGATDAARALRDAELNVTQTKVDQTRASKAEKDAQTAVTQAARDYGKNSPQYRAAVEAEKQANLDLKRANNAVHDSTQDVTRATQDLRDKYAEAIKTDQSRIATLKLEVDWMKVSGASSVDIKKKQDELNTIVSKLSGDQKGLNDALKGMPASVSSSVGIGLNFSSNVGGAIASIGQVSGFAQGGLVTSPGYFAGEEAPRHAEVILATNPAYRQRNVRLWQQAGSMLDIPGFAQGGLVGGAAEVRAADPWAAKAGAKWMAPLAAKWGVPHVTDGVMTAAANAINGLPYRYGAGHGSFNDNAYDCSAAVSYVLHAANFVGSPMDTTAFANWGDAGPGKYITVGTRGAGKKGHAMMNLFNRYFESGGGGGLGPHWTGGWDGAFTLRHPPGYAQGGIHGGPGGNFGDVPPSVLLAGAPALAGDSDFREYMKRYKGVRGFAKGGVRSWQQSVMGEPNLPYLKSFAGTHASGVAAATVAGDRNWITMLESKASNLETFFTIGGRTLTSSETAQVAAVRKSIFDTYGDLVSHEYGLIYAYPKIINALNRALAAAKRKVKGKKGKALTAAQKTVTQISDQITTYNDLLTGVRGNLTGDSDSRDNAWVSYLSTVTGTGSGGGGGGGVDLSGAFANLTSLATQQKLGLAVSQAQYKTLAGAPVGLLTGTFAAGGVQPYTGWALVGEKGPELAHLPGGTRIYPNTQSTGSSSTPVIQVVIEDGAVDPNKIRVIASDEAQVVVRREVRSGIRGLAGAGGGGIRH